VQGKTHQFLEKAGDSLADARCRNTSYKDPGRGPTAELGWHAHNDHASQESGSRTNKDISMSASDSSNGGRGRKSSREQQSSRREQQPSRREQQGGGHSGEGAASAMAQLISEDRRQRRQQPEGEGHPGSQLA